MQLGDMRHFNKNMIHGRHKHPLWLESTMAVGVMGRGTLRFGWAWWSRMYYIQPTAPSIFNLPSLLHLLPSANPQPTCQPDSSVLTPHSPNTVNPSIVPMTEPSLPNSKVPVLCLIPSTSRPQRMRKWKYTLGVKGWTRIPRKPMS